MGNSQNTSSFKVRDGTGERIIVRQYFMLPANLFDEYKSLKITRFQLLKRHMSVTLYGYSHWALLFELGERVLFVAEYGSDGVYLSIFNANDWYSAYSHIMGDSDNVYFQNLPIHHLRNCYFSILCIHIEKIVIEKEYYPKKYNVLSKSCQDFCTDVAEYCLPSALAKALIKEAEKTFKAFLPNGLLLVLANEFIQRELLFGKVNLKQNFNGFNIDIVQFLQKNNIDNLHNFQNANLSELFKKAIDRVKHVRDLKLEHNCRIENRELEIIEFLIIRIDDTNKNGYISHLDYLYEKLRDSEEHVMTIIKQMSLKISDFNKLPEVECLLVSSLLDKKILITKFLIEIGVDLTKNLSKIMDKIIEDITNSYGYYGQYKDQLILMIDKFGSLITKYEKPDWLLPRFLSPPKSIIQIAFKSPDHDFVRYLIKNGGHINESDEKGETLLHSAVLSEDMSLINFLIESGADGNKKNKSGISAFDLAVTNKKWNIVKVFINDGFINTQKDNNTIKQGSVEDLIILAFRGIFDYSKDSKCSIEIEKNKNVLISLLNNEHFVDIQIFKWLIDEKNKSIYSEDDDKNSVLHTNIYSHSQWKELIDYFILKGAKVNYKNKYGDSPLHIATRHLNLEATKYLLLRGANIDIKDNIGANILLSTLNTPRIILESNGCDDRLLLTFVKWMVEEKNFSVNSVDNDGNTVLHSRIYSYSVWKDLVDYFISKGVNISAKNKKGENAFHFAIPHGNEDQFRYLIEKGLRIFDKDNNGTPLIHKISVAAMSYEFSYSSNKNKNQIELLKFLIDKGCDLNETDNQGCHLIHIASKNMDNDLANFLVQKGIDVFIKDKLGQDAVDYANKYAHGLVPDSIKKAREKINQFGLNQIDRFLKKENFTLFLKKF